MLHGIDIASYQEGIDIYGVDADFIVVKVCGGHEGNGYVNPFWRGWADAVLASGKSLGLYHFAGEYDRTSGREEADYFLSFVGDYIGRAVMVLDWEADAVSFGADYAREWLDVVKDATGAVPMLYASGSVIVSQGLGDMGYPIWCANYPAGYEDIWGYDPQGEPYCECLMWQYTSCGHVGGYDGNLDCNVFYGDRNDWQALCGKEDEHMSRINKMIDHAVSIANDDSHGYSWADRWDIDRDCSSLMYDSANAAGYDVRGIGPELTKYTGTMIDDFTHAGFTCYDDGDIELYPGCILLRDPWGEGGHTEMYIGDGLCVGAHSSETGGVYGEPGDQTGNEISVTPNYGNWDYVLAPPKDEKTEGWDLIMWDAHSAANQRFKFEDVDSDGYGVLVCEADGRAVDAYNEKVGGNVDLWTKHGKDNQRWKFVALDDEGTYKIVSKLDPSYVLDVEGESNDSGAGLCCWKWHGKLNQRWVRFAQDDGSFVIMSCLPTHKVLDCKGNGR